MLTSLYCLKTQSILNANYLKFIGFFTYLKCSYIVFFIGSKKYIYFPINYFNKNLLLFKKYFIFKNSFLLNSICGLSKKNKKINFLSFFLQSKKYLENDKLKIYHFCWTLNFKNRIRHLFYLTKIKNFKICLITSLKTLLLNKIVTIDVLKLFNFVVNFRCRVIHMCNNILFFTSLTKKNTFFFIPKFLKKHLLKIRIKKNYLSY